MMENTWVQLATQAPIVLIFGVLMWLITDRFLKSMEKRDTAFLAELTLLRKAQDDHDEFTRAELAKILTKASHRPAPKITATETQ
jgi:hypothetical protein